MLGIQLPFVKTKILRALAAVLAVGLVAGGSWFIVRWRYAVSADELVLYGNVDIHRVDPAFNGSERSALILVQDGDRVKQGQLLASLDMQRLGYAVSRDEARLAAPGRDRRLPERALGTPCVE